MQSSWYFSWAWGCCFSLSLETLFCVCLSSGGTEAIWFTFLVGEGTAAHMIQLKPRKILSVHKTQVHPSCFAEHATWRRLLENLYSSSVWDILVNFSKGAAQLCTMQFLMSQVVHFWSIVLRKLAVVAWKMLSDSSLSLRQQMAILTLLKHSKITW